MQSFHRTQGSESRLTYAIEVAAAVRRDPATRHLAPPLDEANARLEEAWWQRLRGAFACHRARAELRVQRMHFGKALSGLQMMVQVETHIEGSPLERELFPDGIEGAKAWAGRRQLELALAVRRRLTASGNPGAESVRASYLARFTAELEAFTETVVAIEAARAELLRLREVEDEVREDHAKALALTEAGLRVLFPRDATRRRVYEPPRKARRRSRAAEEEDPLARPPEPSRVARASSGRGDGISTA